MREKRREKKRFQDDRRQPLPVSSFCFRPVRGHLDGEGRLGLRLAQGDPSGEGGAREEYKKEGRRRGSRERGKKKQKNRRSKKKLEQAEVFEEIPTMDFPFHGIPTVPPRKDMMHLVSGKKRERERENRERERKNREKERQREREQRTTHSKREGGKKRFLLPDFLLPGLPLSRHRRALVDLRGCQARPLGRRDLEVQ